MPERRLPVTVCLPPRLYTQMTDALRTARVEFDEFVIASCEAYLAKNDLLETATTTTETVTVPDWQGGVREVPVSVTKTTTIVPIPYTVRRYLPESDK